jgi:hypothetical protein
MLGSGVTIVATIIAAVDTTVIAATSDPPIAATSTTTEEEDTAATAIESVATIDPPIVITTIATGGALTMTATGVMIAAAAKIEIARCGGRRSGKSRRRGGRNGLERRVLRRQGS